MAASTPVSATGTIDGADFQIDLPANWNGDLDTAYGRPRYGELRALRVEDVVG